MNKFQSYLFKINRFSIIHNVDDPTNVYVHRYSIFDQESDCANIFLHKIFRSDADDYLHDHMWNWASFILWGSYEETFIDGSRDYCKWLSFRRDKAETFHKLILTKPVWTMFFHAKPKQEWGFLVKGKKVFWREHLNYWD